MNRFWRSGDSTSKRVLDVLEFFFYLRLWKIIIQRVAVVKFRMNDSLHSTGFRSEMVVNLRLSTIIREHDRCIHGHQLGNRRPPTKAPRGPGVNTCKLILYLGLNVYNYRAAPCLWNYFLVPSAMSLFRSAKSIR